MIIKQFWLLLFVSLMQPILSYSQSDIEEQKTQVAMRMIGHELMLLVGDSTSRVLPIEVVNSRYKISFDTEFQFDPEELVVVVNEILFDTKLATNYVVEVRTADSNALAYSYAMGALAASNLIPCRGRILPRDCYIVFITLEEEIPVLASVSDNTSSSINSEYESGDESIGSFLMIPMFLLFGVIAFIWKKKQEPINNPNLIAIGDFRFDTRNTALSLNNETIALSHKEADLLSLLYTSVNVTLEREAILKAVWGDEGDYVGRTLDVFISKLRKKLEGDESVKITNVRGVGYKLIVDA